MLTLSGALCGSVSAQPSKSLSHRAIIAAALSRGTSEITNVALSNDTLATLRCVEALGAKLELSGNRLKVRGIDAPCEHALLDCGESASTYRFLYPVAPLLAKTAEFLLAPSLANRPIEPLSSLLAKKGLVINGNSIGGKYSNGLFEISGGVSSQFISGLLFALPLLNGESRIALTSPLQSKPYVELTRACLAAFNVNTLWRNGEICVFPGGYSPCEYAVEGDWSHASLFFAAGALYESVTVTGLDTASLQGDRAMLDILRRMGARVACESGAVTVSAKQLSGIDIDVSNLPDLVPAIAVLALCAQGDTRIRHAERLRLKESNRLAALCCELSRLGGNIVETEDGLFIRGGTPLHFANCLTHGDHRIAMALAVLAGRCRGGLTIDYPECVNKSAPRFFEEYAALGGCAK